MVEPLTPDPPLTVMYMSGGSAPDGLNERMGAVGIPAPRLMLRAPPEVLWGSDGGDRMPAPGL